MALDTICVGAKACASNRSDLRRRWFGCTPVLPSEPHRTTGARWTASVAASCNALFMFTRGTLVHSRYVTNRVRNLACVRALARTRAAVCAAAAGLRWPVFLVAMTSPAPRLAGRPSCGPYRRMRSHKGLARHERPAPRWRGSPPLKPRSPCRCARWRRSWCRTATDECGADTSSTAWLSPRDQQPRTAPSELRAGGGKAGRTSRLRGSKGHAVRVPGRLRKVAIRARHGGCWHAGVPP
jgi:hypothetical protein